MEIREIFRENMRKRRKEMGLTQEELAERADLSFTFISQIEQGEKEPSLRTAYKISQALKTTIDILLSEKEDRGVAMKRLLNVVKGTDKESIGMTTKVVSVVMEERRKYIASPRKEKGET